MTLREIIAYILIAIVIVTLVAAFVVHSQRKKRRRDIARGKIRTSGYSRGKNAR